MASVKLCSVIASALLKSHAVNVSKSSISNLLKKIPLIVDKSLITKVCVDDFAFCKRYYYGSVMVYFETHRIIDILESRVTEIIRFARQKRTDGYTILDITLLLHTSTSTISRSAI